MKMTAQQMKLAAKARNKLETIENVRDLKKNHLTLAEFDTVIEMYNELVMEGKSETFMTDVAEWFIRLGFNVTKGIVNYKVTI